LRTKRVGENQQLQEWMSACHQQTTTPLAKITTEISIAEDGLIHAV
jgi:hypothetical protein